MKRAKGLGATARPTVVAILGAATLLLASCSSTAGSAEAEPAEGQSAATEQSAALPEGVASQGKIVWAVEPYYPPFTLSDDDGGELVGINIDLAHEMSDRLGVEAEIVAGSFDGLIPGVQSQRYDVAIATMADTEPRREQVDFIDYFQSGSAVFVVKSFFVVYGFLAILRVFQAAMAAGSVAFTSLVSVSESGSVPASWAADRAPRLM